MKKSLFLLLLFIILFITCSYGLSIGYPPLPNLQRPPLDLSPEAKLVCLFFDDGWQNQYDVALPVLLKYNFKATFGIISGFVGTGEDFWKYMGEKELKKLNKQGMDIACHSKRHLDLTANLTDQQLEEEIIGSKKHLGKLGFRIRTFIHPYNQWDDRVINYVIQAGYVCA